MLFIFLLRWRLQRMFWSISMDLRAFFYAFNKSTIRAFSSLLYGLTAIKNTDIYMLMFFLFSFFPVIYFLSSIHICLWLIFFSLLYSRLPLTWSSITLHIRKHQVGFYQQNTVSHALFLSNKQIPIHETDFYNIDDWLGLFRRTDYQYMPCIKHHIAWISSTGFRMNNPRKNIFFEKRRKTITFRVLLRCVFSFTCLHLGKNL